MKIQQWFSIRLGRRQFWTVAFTCTAIRSTVSSGIRWTILKKWADPSSQGRHQFYSYMPAESPTTRFFPVRGMKLDVGLTFQTWWQPFFFSWCCQGVTDWSWHQYLGDYQVYLMISRKFRNPSCKLMLNTKLSMIWLQECTCVKWPRPICGTWSGWEIWLLLVGFQLSSSFFDLSQENQFRWPPTENTIATNYKP